MCTVGIDVVKIPECMFELGVIYIIGLEVIRQRERKSSIFVEFVDFEIPARFFAWLSEITEKLST